MTQQPDNLFRDKLEHFQLHAPAGAWSKIEAGLDRPKEKRLWFKIAAGLLLPVTAGIFIWSTHSKDVVSASEEVAIVSSGQQAQESISESVVSSPTPAIAEEVTHVEGTARPLPQYRNSNTTTGITISGSQIVTQVEQRASVAIEELLAEATTETDFQETPPTAAGVYIVYTADEVNRKYLRAQPADDATPGDKKSSRMQMLVGVAMNLKSGDTGWGELRQAKDEIFALNFLEPKKEQSKKN